MFRRWRSLSNTSRGINTSREAQRLRAGSEPWFGHPQGHGLPPRPMRSAETVARTLHSRQVWESFTIQHHSLCIFVIERGSSCRLFEEMDYHPNDDGNSATLPTGVYVFYTIRVSRLVLIGEISFLANSRAIMRVVPRLRVAQTSSFVLCLKRQQQGRPHDRKLLG